MPPPVGLGVDRRRLTRQGTRGLARIPSAATSRSETRLLALSLSLEQRDQIARDTTKREDNRCRDGSDEQQEDQAEANAQASAYAEIAKTHDGLSSSHLNDYL